MTRWLGIFLTCVSVPLLVLAQADNDPGKDETVDKLGKEVVRISAAMGDQLEAMAKKAGAGNARKDIAKLQKLVDEFVDLTDKIADLPAGRQDSFHAKYKKDLDIAQERMQRAEARINGQEPPAGEPKPAPKTEPKPEPKPETKPDIKPEPKPEAKPEDKQEPKGDAKTEKMEDIVKRLKDNMEKAVDKLASNDPGKDIVKHQDDIIKDLKELLKQNSPDNQSGGGGQGSSSKSGGASGSNGGTSGESGGANKPSQGGGSAHKNPPPNGGGNDKKDDPKNAQAGGGSPKGGSEKNKDAKAGGGQGGNAEKKDPNFHNADQYKDVWGHLPEHKRLEMESQTKGKFMDRYVDLLDQYYRTIAEQAKKD